MTDCFVHRRHMGDACVVDGGNVTGLVSDVDEDAAEVVRDVHVRHEALQNGETGDIALEEKTWQMNL